MKKSENVSVPYELLCKIYDALGSAAWHGLYQYKTALEANADFIRPEVIKNVNAVFERVTDVFNQVAELI